jgi:hypothetical protein
VDNGADGFATPASQVDRVDDQFGAQVIGDRPANATAGERDLADGISVFRGGTRPPRDKLSSVPAPDPPSVSRAR